MTQKLNFDIEDIQLIDEVNDSQFALVNLDVFASGLNLHGMTTSIETLKRTAKTILLKPLVAKYDKFRDDIGSHDPEQIIIGVVPNDSQITFFELPDGRTMMKTTALIWKNYCHNMLDFFKRDNGKKPLSVEMLVLENKENKDGITELLDYCFSAITILGSKITPAIPGAQAEIIRFAIDEKIKFSYEDLDLTIPDQVKQNMQDALDMWAEMEEQDAKTISLAVARHFVKNSKLTVEKFKQIQRYVPKKFKENHIDSLLWGGFEGQQYFKDISEKLSELNERKSVYFNIENEKNKEKEDNKYMSKKEKENENFSEEIIEVIETENMAENPEKEEVDNTENFSLNSSQIMELLSGSLSEYVYGEHNCRKYWVSAFDETYAYIYDNEDGKCYRTTYIISAGIAICNLESKEYVISGGYKLPMEFAEDKSNDDKDSGIEEFSESNKNFSNNVYLDVAAALAFLKSTTESHQEMVDEYGTAINMAISEMSKEGELDFSTIAYGMMKCAEMYNAKMAKMKEDSDVYMNKYSEEKFAELENFKTEHDNIQKNFTVDETIDNLLEKFSIPEDTINQMKEEAKEYTLSNIDTWKNSVKVKAIDFSVKPISKDESQENFIRMGFPFMGNNNVELDSNDVWAKKVN